MNLLVKDTAWEERGQTMDRGNPFGMYQDYIDGKKEMAEINADYRAHFRADKK